MVSLYTSQTPNLTNENDGAPGYVLGGGLVFSEPGQITHVRFFSTTSVGGTYGVAVYEATGSDDSAPGGNLLQSKTLAGPPAPGVWHEEPLTAPITVTPNTVVYRPALLNTQGRYTAITGFFLSGGLTNGSISSYQTGTDPVGLGAMRNGVLAVTGSMTYPSTGAPGGASYLIDVVFVPAGGTTPVTSTLTGKWRVYNRVTSSLTGKWRVYNRITSTLTGKWSVFGRVTSTLTAKWGIYTSLTSSLTAKWTIWQRVSNTLTAKWTVLASPEVPPEISSIYLAMQRDLTAKYIADDPTTIELQPYSRVPTGTGGWTPQPGAPRAAQTVKMILQSNNQQPTVTVAGVERVIDYHLMGRHDMQIAVGDVWTAEDGTVWEVLGFTEGWDYMTKAFVGRHVPRNVRP